MSWSGIFKFLLGFLIAIALLVGSSVAVALYFVTKLTTPPPKPIFANDKPVAKPKPAPSPPSPATATKPAPTPVAAASPVTNASDTISTPSPESSPTPTETPTPKPLEPGAYRGRVTWPNGLILRDSPGTDSQRIGGIGYNQQIVVVAESDDKRWVKIRVEENNEEGWVKAGNVERVESEQTPATTQ